MHRHQWFKRALILIPVLIGVAVLVIAPKMKQPPQKVKATEVATKAKIIKPLYQAVIPKVIGYGTTAPSRVWDAVAEVAGRVVWVSEGLREGKIIPKDTELLRIDDSEYKLALSQINAQLHASEIKADTIKKSLSVEQKSQASLRKEVTRQKNLQKKGLLSVSALESAERSVLKADATLQGLKNSLAINEAERATLRVQKEQAELDLERTRILTPFDVRIVDIEVHEARFANKGQRLFTADATDKTEIEARIPIGQLRPLIASKQKDKEAKHPGALGLDALVRLRTSTHTVEWEAKVERVAGQIDRQTQTTGVIVVVDDPYKKAKPGQRPPLIRNTFVEVELRGKPKGEQVIIPVSAIHEGNVYLMDEEERLEIRKIRLDFIEGRYAVLRGGLMPDEKLIVSDLVPAIKDMLLDPIEDRKTRKMLMMEVMGKEAFEKKAAEQAALKAKKDAEK